MTSGLCLLLTALAAPADGMGLEVAHLGHTPAGEVHLGTERYLPRPGDILLYRHASVAQNLVYSLAGAGGVTHAGLVVARPDGRPALLEAPGPFRSVRLAEMGPLLHGFQGRLWVRRRKVALTGAESALLTAFASAQVG